jgi:hypothetical protein
MIKDRSTGYVGSKFVGVPGQPEPAAPATSPVMAQLKTRATGYQGSQYVGGPGLPATAGGPLPEPSLANNNNTGITGGTGVNTTQVQPNQSAFLPPSGAPASTSVPSSAPASPLVPRATEGFDQGKLNDPTNAQTHKYVGGRILAAGGGVNEVLADPKFAGWSKVGDDKIRSPEGSVYDLARDFSGANGQQGANVAQWTYVGGGPAGVRNDGIKGNDPNSANYTQPGGLGYTGGGGGDLLHDGIKGNAKGGGAIGMAGPAPVNATGGGSFQDQIRARLLAQMDQVGQPVTAEDPTIAAAMGGARLESERGLELSRKEQAERMYAQGGLNSDALGQGLQQSRERAAGGLSTLQGDLMGREMTARRSQMAQLLNQALQTGDNESARALQLKLSQMDNEIRKAGMAQAGQFHDDSYGLQKGQFQYDQDRDAARARAGMNF